MSDAHHGDDSEPIETAEYIVLLRVNGGFVAIDIAGDLIVKDVSDIKEALHVALTKLAEAIARQ